MYRIMIADDESAIRNGLVHCIEWEKAYCEVVYIAVDGQDALDHIPLCNPDIILSDIHMPRVDGLELSNIVQKSYHNIKVVLLTGYQDFTYAQLAIRYQVTDYLLKPVSPQKLIKTIAAIVSTFEQNQEASIRINQLEKDAIETNVLKEQMIYYRLLDGVSFTSAIADDFKKSLIEHFILIEFHLLKMNGNNLNNNPEEDIQKLQEIIESTFIGIRSILVPKSQHTIYTIISTDISEGGTQDNIIFKKCEEIAEIVDSFTGFITCISISKPCESLSQIMDAKKEVHRKFKLLNSESSSVVLKPDNNTYFPYIPAQDVRGFINQFILALKNYDDKQALKTINSVFEYSIQNKLSFIELQNICFLLLNISIRDLIDYRCSDEQMQVLSNTYYQELIICETFHQLSETFKDIVTLVIARIKGQNDASITIISDVVEYISQHYNEELTLDKLAVYVHVSNSYLSRLFKKKQEITISNYIQNIRLEQAKKLMNSTNLKTYEIAEKVGINDPVYFSKLFKKVEGLTPKEFRQKR